MQANKKKQGVAQRKRELAKVLTEIESNRTKRKNINTLDDLANLAVTLLQQNGTKIGYSTLLKNNEYRRLLDVALINILPKYIESYKRKLNFKNATPEELQQKIRELEYDIGELKLAEKVYVAQLANLEKTETSNPDITKTIEPSSSDIPYSNKTCIALNFLLMYLSEQRLGIEFDENSNSIKDSLGSTIVTASHLELYKEWLNKTRR
ncbi:hypothetical protein ACR30L_16125 [Psychromonas sp. PT13]|uniref:hypothetical protein n=1 Tax=Psychromonas sp. PT13 TaxID=3439547 RepID=UPI003EC0E73E